jgi:peptidylprolyl isomerase
MPKTTKREATKRAAKIARAHSTELPKLEVKEPQERKRPPGYRPPARGLARYPWATGLIIALIIVGVGALYFNHVGPFAIHKTPAKTAPKKTTAAVSPCLNSSILKQITDTSPAPTAAQIAAINHDYKQAPAMTINTNKVYCAGINTNRGLIVLELDPQLAPQTVNNFVFLAQHHFYDGLVFHRVIQSGSGIHIIQTGDPLGNSPDVKKRGTGGPGYKFNDEPVKGDYTAGTVAMANSGPNTNGSQFFINVTDNSSQLQKQYNLFGHVVQGMDVVKNIKGPDTDPGADPSLANVTPDVMNHVIVVQAP